MAINFPNAPTVGQEFTSDGLTFRWTGTAWILLGLPMPFATEAEALAGTAKNRVMSPLTTKAVLNARPPAGSPFDGSPNIFGASRELDVIYQSPYDRPMGIMVSGPITFQLLGSSNQTSWLNLARRSRYDSALTGNGVVALIPPRWFYRVTTGNASPSVSQWREFR